MNWLLVAGLGWLVLRSRRGMGSDVARNSIDTSGAGLGSDVARPVSRTSSRRMNVPATSMVTKGASAGAAAAAGGGSGGGGGRPGEGFTP